MAEKDDRENLGDDQGQRQRQFLLELSSVRQDRVPSPEIKFARTIQSYDHDAISDICIYNRLFLLTVSAPPETGGIKLISGMSKISYIHHVPK